MKKIILTCLIALLAFPVFADDAPSYKKALKKFHRHGEQFNFSTFHDNITWDVIYKSAEFREAMAYKYAKDYRLNDAELQSRLADEQRAALKGPEFIVLFYTYGKTWNDLAAVDSVWKIRLEGDGKQFDPIGIQEFKPTAIDTVMYPYYDPWIKSYSVLFSPEAYSILEGKFSLSVFGARGKNTLRWNLSPQ